MAKYSILIANPALKFLYFAKLAMPDLFKLVIATIAP
jgi:hypothetical protein